MKLWKKTAAMVMAFGFAFSATACGGILPTDSSSGSPSTSTSTGGGSSEVTLKPVTEKFVNAVEKSIDEAKSFDIMCTAKLGKNNSRDEMYYTQIKMPVSVSITEENVNLHAEVFLIEERDTQKTETQQADVYIVDNYVYVSTRMWDSAKETYVMSPYYKSRKGISEAVEVFQQSFVEVNNAPVAEVMEIVEELLTRIQEADFMPSLESLKAQTLNSFTIEEDVMWLGFDAPSYINDTVDAILDYDYEQTVEAVIDAALIEYAPAAAGETQLTMDGILDKMASYGPKKLSEVYVELDAWVEEKCGKDIQATYDSIVNDETFEKALTFILDQAQVEDAEEIIVEMQGVTDWYSMLFGENSDLKDMTVDGLLAAIVAENSGGVAMDSTGAMYPVNDTEREEVSMEALAESFKEMADTKLKDIPAVQELRQEVQAFKDNVDINELGMEVGAEFEGEGQNLSLEKLYWTAAFNYSQEFPEHNREYKQAIDFSFNFAAENFSKNATEIELPEDMDVTEFWLCENACGRFIMEEDYKQYKGAILCENCFMIKKALPNATNFGSISNTPYYVIMLTNQELEPEASLAGQFKVEEKGAYTITVSTNGSYSAYLVDADGRYIQYLSSHETLLLDAGTYYIVVYNHSSYTITANLIVSASNY